MCIGLNDHVSLVVGGRIGGGSDFGSMAAASPSHSFQPPPHHQLTLASQPLDLATSLSSSSSSPSFIPSTVIRLSPFDSRSLIGLTNENNNSSPSSSSSSLQQQQGPSSRPLFHHVFTETTVEQGQSLSLFCIASGSPLPTIRWRVYGIPLEELNDDEDGENDGKGGGGEGRGSASHQGQGYRFRYGDHLTTNPAGLIVSYVNVSRVNVQDGGLYECEANNSVGTVRHAASIHVYGPPYIRRMRPLRVTAGHKLVIQCPVSGYPIDKITWFHGVTRLPNNRRQEIFPNGTMVIHDLVKASDTGEYSCRASNKAGLTATSSVQVHVMSKHLSSCCLPHSPAKSISSHSKTPCCCSPLSFWLLSTPQPFPLPSPTSFEPNLI